MAILISRRGATVWHDLAVGVVIGVAGGIKTNAAFVGLGIAVPLIRERAWVRLLRTGAVAAVATFGLYFFSYGLDALKPLPQVSTRVISPSIWQLVQMISENLDLANPSATSTLIGVLWPPLLLALAWYLYNRLSPDVPAVLAATCALTFAWVLVAPWSLPWYTALAWVTLALLPRNSLTRWLTLATGALALLHFNAGHPDEPAGRPDPVAMRPEPEQYRAWADAAVGALQRWYNPRTGLWKTTGWWNCANALTAVIQHSQRTGEHRYRYVIETTFGRAQRVNPGFSNEYYDDDGWWALAWIAAFDLTGEVKYLDLARKLFTGMAAGWDDVCGGGLWWTRRKTYKNAIPNELFLLIAGRLHQRTTGPGSRASGYLDWALREWQWFSGQRADRPGRPGQRRADRRLREQRRHDLDLQPGRDHRRAHRAARDHRRRRLPQAGGSHRGGGAARPDGAAGHPGRAGRAGTAQTAAATSRSSRASSSGTCTSSTGTARAPNTATSSSPTRPRYGATPGTGGTRSGWHGPGRSTGPTRPGRDRRSTRSTPRWVSPIPGQAERVTRCTLKRNSTRSCSQ